MAERKTRPKHFEIERLIKPDGVMAREAGNSDPARFYLTRETAFAALSALAKGARFFARVFYNPDRSMPSKEIYDVSMKNE